MSALILIAFSSIGAIYLMWFASEMNIKTPLDLG